MALILSMAGSKVGFTYSLNALSSYKGLSSITVSVALKGLSMALSVLGRLLWRKARAEAAPITKEPARVTPTATAVVSFLVVWTMGTGKKKVNMMRIGR